MRDRLVVVNSLSKTYAMTGWRVGYALGPKPILDGMKKIQSHDATHTAARAQAAALEALRGPQESVAMMREEYRRRRDELADLGRDFDRTAARLKLLMDGQRRLLHDVSHEMRSSLARLQAAVGLARQHPGNVDLALDRVERESVRMDRLVDELLTLSRLEAGMASRQQDSVDMAELVTEVVADARFELAARSTVVAFDIRVESLHAAKVTGNAEMLHRALENIVRKSINPVYAEWRLGRYRWRIQSGAARGPAYDRRRGAGCCDRRAHVNFRTLLPRRSGAGGLRATGSALRLPTG